MEFILNNYCFKRTNLINYAIILDLSCGDASIVLMKILFVNLVGFQLTFLVCFYPAFKIPLMLLALLMNDDISMQEMH